MKISISILLILCTLKFLSADYPRLTRRGLPLPPRPPPPPQYVKKWHHHPPQQKISLQHQYQKAHHPRGPPPTRRPIPVHMPPSHKIPMGIVPAASRPVANPVRVFWKNTQTTLRTPVEKAIVQKYAKPFLSSPSINTQEYDYHIQTNSIPTHTNPIKQVGEKGPIHTIPAPNLSLADKPPVREEVQHQVAHVNYQHQQHQQHLLDQKHHQYQVTESEEPPPKQNLYGKRLQQQQQQQDQQLYYISEEESAALQGLNTQLSQPQALPLQSAVKTPQTEVYYNVQDQNTPQIGTKELYELLSAYPNQQQQILEAFQIPLYQTQQIPQNALQQPAGSYQALVSQQPYHVETNYNIQHLQQPQQLQQSANQPEISYVQLQQDGNLAQLSDEFIQQAQAISNSAPDKMTQPQYQSFNYEEQGRTRDQRQKNHFDSTAYNMDQDVESSETSHTTIPRGPMDAVAQSQYIQNYFNSRGDNGQGNKVEPDAKISKEQKPASNGANRPGDITGAFYSSLPSKQAADALATLQAAGKINSNLMQLSRNSQIHTSKTPMTIYVSENTQQSEETEESQSRNADVSQEESNSGEEKLEEQDYSDDYTQEETSEEINNEKVKENFGHRLKQNTKSGH